MTQADKIETDGPSRELGDATVERVAKAICLADGQCWPALSGSYDGRRRRDNYRRFAEAAVAAMKGK